MAARPADNASQGVEIISTGYWQFAHRGRWPVQAFACRIRTTTLERSRFVRRRFALGGALAGRLHSKRADRDRPDLVSLLRDPKRGTRRPET